MEPKGFTHIEPRVRTQQRGTLRPCGFILVD